MAVKSDPLKFQYERFNAAMHALPVEVTLGTLTPAEAFARIKAARLLLKNAQQIFNATPRGQKTASQDKWAARATKADESEKTARAAILQAASRILPQPPKPAPAPAKHKETPPQLTARAGSSSRLPAKETTPLVGAGAAAPRPLEERAVFIAQKNQALTQSPAWETARKVASFIVYVILICFILTIPIALARWYSREILLPAERLTPQQLQAKEAGIGTHAFLDGQLYEVHPITIQTADGASLRGFHYRHPKSDENTPTVIYFNGNCDSCLESPVLSLGCLSDAEHPMNFVAFDYRGVGISSESRPIESAQDLVKDGDAVYQYVRDHLKTDEERIHVYGHSLGGAVAAETLALQPDWRGRLISDRSFSRTKDFLPWGAQFLADLDRVNLDAVEALGKLRGKTTILYAGYDPVIPDRTSLNRHAGKGNRIDRILLPQKCGENEHNYNYLSEAHQLGKLLSQRLREN